MPSRRKSAPSNLELTKASPSSSERGSQEAMEKAAKLHKRSRSGCFTCRLRRKKCDENHPSCGACSNLCVKCEYKRPLWWGNAEQRRLQKERIKNKIKQTKTSERTGVLADPMRHRSMTVATPMSPEYDFNRPLLDQPYDLFSSHLPTPAYGQVSYTPFTPFEVDVKTERQTYVNDVPLRHDSSISTFSTFAPPQLSAPLPAFPEEDWLSDNYFNQVPLLDGIDQTVCEPSLGQSYSLSQANIPVDDNDRHLLDHFIHNVLRLIFPVLEINQGGYTRAQAILHALETNKCYLHCCLSVAAIHLKTTEGLFGEQIDHDIVRHRYEAVSQLCQTLGQDVNHEEILDATLAMIFFHCSVGSSDDYLPDIPWYDHFQAACNLVNRLELPGSTNCATPYLLPPFSMTLTSWIDILGSTMMGKTPHFAHTYRSKHLGGSALGFRELMGCDDRVMYLISEIVCLDALKNEGRVDGMAVCSHVSALGRQLEFTEPPDQTLEDPVSPLDGSIRPHVLSKNLTMVFRTAARIYLCSLVPGFDRTQTSNLNLVTAVTAALAVIPTGPDGFDRSLVWPLLITGAYSTPESTFRGALAERAAALGAHGELGSFGRMYRVLQEVWRETDPILPEATTSSEDKSQSPVGSPVLKQEGSASPERGSSVAVPTETAANDEMGKDLHWRYVMRKNDWQYLLI